MLIRYVIAALLSCISILATGTSSAQPVSADVTFEVPLNLTRVHGSITNVKIACKIDSQAFSRLFSSGDLGRIQTAETVIPVNQGSVVQIAQVVFPLTDADFENTASGRHATYECKLFAKTASGQWVWFLPANLDPVRAMTPVPVDITGAFVW